MKVVQALAKGMCFGVQDALEIAFRAEDAHEITIWGELVHNEAVLSRLERQGFAMRGESDRGALPATEKVLITAHGVSDTERRRLLDAGKMLVDTTCPLVRRVHDTAKELHDEGRLVVVVGRPGHVEVRGIVGDLHRYRVVASANDVRTWSHARIGIVCQSTVMEALAHDVVDRVRELNPESDVVFRDTICDPTKQRILALEALLPRCDAIVVVGGRNSNNTKQLVRLAESRGARVLHIQGEEDLDPGWFEGCTVVGLTAGTSTLDWTIAKVHHALTLIESDVPETA